MDPGGEHQALFPMFSLSPTTRQTTRALQEIQAQRPGLLVLEEEGLSVAHIPTQPTDITDRVSWTVNLSDALDTPSPSPDEMAIQARGRRRVPLTFSPDLATSPLAARHKEVSTTPLARHPGRSHLSSLSQVTKTIRSFLGNIVFICFMSMVLLPVLWIKCVSGITCTTSTASTAHTNLSAQASFTQ